MREQGWKQLKKCRLLQCQGLEKMCVISAGKAGAAVG